MDKCGGFAVRTGVGGVARGARFCSGREAATHVAAKAACVHVRLACAFVLLRCPKAPLRETWLPLLAPPSMPHDHAAGGASSLLSMPVSLAPPGNGHGPCGAAIRSASMLAPLAPPAVRVVFNTMTTERKLLTP